MSPCNPSLYDMTSGIIILNKTPTIIFEKIDAHSNIGLKLYMKNQIWDKNTTECKIYNFYMTALNIPMQHNINLLHITHFDI